MQVVLSGDLVPGQDLFPCFSGQTYLYLQYLHLCSRLEVPRAHRHCYEIWIIIHWQTMNHAATVYSSDQCNLHG